MALAPGFGYSAVVSIRRKEIVVAKFEAQTFKNCRVVLDGNEYVGCAFEDVIIEYGGGAFVLNDSTFTNYRFAIVGDLARGIQAMRAIAHSDSPKAVKRLVDDMVAILRRPNPVETFTLG